MQSSDVTLTEPNEEQVLVDVHYIKRRLNVPVSWVYAAAESKKLPSIKIGKYLRFERSAIEAFIDAGRQGGKGGGR